MNGTVTRKGVMTSEFAGMILTFVTIIANGTRFVEIPGDQIILLAGMATAYGGGRTLLKNTLAKSNT